MAFFQSINEIVSHINKNYFARPNQYLVAIVGGGSVEDATDDVMVNCSSVTVPGVNVALMSDTRYGIGMREFWATVKSFTELNLTFYESEDEAERKFFVDWINKIYDKQSRRINYKKDYVKDMIITQFDRRGEICYQCRIIDCFPSNISQLDRGYASGDQVPQFNVNIQFTEVEELYKGEQGEITIS